MTDGPEEKKLKTEVTFQLRWPLSAARDPKVATKFGIVMDDVGGVFLLMGNVAPPPWFTQADRSRGLPQGEIEVDVAGAFYLTPAALRELHRVIQNHLDAEGG
ncbi:hypothetical protein AWB90_05300 [Mycobacterium paraense]|uniref:Uncharacterized protein n=1 Tax=Mycobacterium paraense TaxID=767916 RepID=A0A1X2AJ11_9MYCO|nr:hypothetical protein [Mycobacterium paraense]ORW51340.1 hypothetical protein AWB90_05300 [Mycobacterium paraense]